jgi:hypothetical protein
MGQVATQRLEIEDFSGGMTDHYINGPTNRGQLFSNLNILPNKKLISRWGSHLDEVANPLNAQIPAGNQRIGALLNYNNSATLLVQSAKKFWYRNPAAYTELVGPTSNPVFNVNATTNFISYSEWNRHLFVTSDAFPFVQKIYADGSGVLQVRTAGLPEIAAPTVTVGAAGALNYIYAFHYFSTYTIGSQVFEDRGPVVQVALANSADPAGTANAITVIPVLANGATHNYATTTIKVHIFRTLDGGAEFFKVGEVTNGTTTFNDSMSDATAEDAESLYLSGGVLDNDPPPLSKYIHIVNNVGYYGHIKIGSEVFPNKYRTSVPFDPDSCPGAFEDEVEDEIAGISSAQSVPIILCKRHIYRSEGNFDELGRGSVSHTRLSDTAGCISALSAVQAEGGLFWAGNDGFYYSDGYKVMKISDHLNSTYAAYIAAMTDAHRITGAFDEKYRRIIWTIQANSASSDNDTCVILELRWGISPEMVFTTMTGGEDSFSPTFVAFFDKQMYRADRRGFVFIHDEDDDADPKIDTIVSPDLWNRVPIIYDYLGPALNFGTTLGRKWVPKAVITLGNEGNVSVQPNAINDDGAATRALQEIRIRRSFAWGDPEFVWGTPDCQWGAAGIFEQWRRMPARGLRLSYFQMQLTNSYTVVGNSDTYGTGTIDNVVKTLTLDNVDTAWPVDCVDYALSFEVDDYSIQYPVSVRTASTLTFIDVGATSISGSTKWLLKGYKKGEFISILGYAVLYSSNSQSQATYQGSDTGNNA